MMSVGGLAVGFLSAVLFTGPALSRIQEDPSLLTQARVDYQNLRDEPALAKLQQHLETHPGDSAALHLKAACLASMQRFEDAAQTADLVEPKNRSLQVLYADCLSHRQNQRDKALRIVDELIAAHPEDIQAAITRARILIRADRAEQALEQLQKIHELTSRSADARLATALAFESLGRNGPAAKVYNSVVVDGKSLDPFDQRVTVACYSGLARVKAKLGDFAAASTMYQQLVDQFPRNAEWLLELSICQQMRNRLADGAANLEKAAKLEPSSARIRRKAGEMYRALSMSAEAIAHFEALAEISPGDTIAPLRLAQLYMETGHLDLARKNITRALSLEEHSPRVQEVHGFFLERSGDLEAAVRAYRSALTDPLRFDSMYHLGLILARSPEPSAQQEGRELLETYGKVQPRRKEIDAILARMEDQPEDPYLMTQLAVFLNNSASYEAARSYIRRAAELAPGAELTALVAGYVYANLGDTDNARKSFQTLRELAVARGAGISPDVTRYLEVLENGDGTLELPLEVPVIRR